MKRICLLFFIFFNLASIAIGQNFTKTGTIYDGEFNEPVIGAYVIVKNTSNGVTTDFDGTFSIENVAIGDTLVFSYIGFQNQERIITDQQPISITLTEDVTSLEEVVVVGYGTQTKKELTGAVAVLGSETIEKLNVVQVENALQGQVAGVHITSQSGSPGGASNIRIRGVSTNGNNNPLILVDGNVIEDLSVINPNDIESMNVLKDATAGIYGVRAANGVILITTKSGYRNTPLKIELDAFYGLQQTSRRIPLLDATEYAVLANEAHAAGGDAPPFPNVRSLGTGTDWQDEVFQQAPMAQVNLNFNGGTKKSKYSIGASYLSQDGIVGGNDANFNRFTGRVNYNLDVVKGLKFNTSFIYTNSNRKSLIENSLGSILFNAINMAPTIPVRDANGEFTLAEGLGNEVINPIHQISNAFNRSNTDKISGVLGLSYQVFKDLKAETRFQFNSARVEGIVFSPEVFYGSGKVFNVDRNSVFENSDLYQDYTWDTYLTYSKQLGVGHNFKALLGMSVFKTTGELSAFTGFDLPSNSFENASLENAAETIDAYINGGNVFDSRLLSYFTRLQYDYKSKYFLSAVLRRDGSTKFGPNNRFGFFPSVSAGWALSDEPFMQGEFFDFLKLRGSYGIIGNDRIADFRFVSLLNGEGTYVFNDEITFGRAISALSNPEIRWERQKTLDIGLDAKFLNNHFDFTFDYFQKRTEDLLVVSQVAGVLGASAPGASAPVINAGIVENEGLEFQLGYTNEVNDNFNYSLSFNATTIRNEVIFVNSDNGFLTGGSFGVGLEPPSRMEVGQPIGYFFGLQTDGIFQSQAELEAHATQANAQVGDLRYVDINNDGIIDSDDRTNIGDPIPDVTMGFNVSVGYKNFDFSAYTFASVGNEIVRNYERNQPLTNRNAYTKGRWAGPNTSTDFPRVTTGSNSNNLLSDFYVEDGSYLRMQTLQLGYTITNENSRFDKFRIYVSVNNAFTFTGYRGFDPSASSGAPLGGGIDQGFYPVPRTVIFGLNVKF